MSDFDVAEHLRNLLLDVALSRGQDEPDAFIEVLENTIECYPAFAENARLHDGWIAEMEPLIRSLEDTELIAADLQVRRAMILMRRDDLPGALAILDGYPFPDWAIAPRYRVAVTRTRVLARLGRLDEARAALLVAEERHAQVASRLPTFDALLAVARAELAMRRGDEARWELAHRAIALVPADLIEERIDVHQMLAALYVARGDASGAYLHLQEARDLLAACGVQSGDNLTSSS